MAVTSTVLIIGVRYMLATFSGSRKYKNSKSNVQKWKRKCCSKKKKQSEDAQKTSTPQANSYK